VIANRGLKVVLLGSIAMLPAAVECGAFVLKITKVIHGVRNDIGLEPVLHQMN
jgi:hypothetical protein